MFAYQKAVTHKKMCVAVLTHDVSVNVIKTIFIKLLLYNNRMRFMFTI